MSLRAGGVVGVLAVGLVLALAWASPVRAGAEPLPEGAVARLGAGVPRGAAIGCGVGLLDAGRVLAVCGHDAVLAWQVETGRVHAVAPTGKGESPLVTDLAAFSRDASVAAVGVGSATVGRRVRCWDTASGALRLEVPIRSIRMRTAYLTDYALSDDGRFLAVAGRTLQTLINRSRTRLSVWDTTTGKRLWKRSFRGVGGLTGGYGDAPFELSFSRDGKALLAKVGRRHGPAGLALWRAADGKRLAELPPPTYGVSFAANGLVTVYEGTLDELPGLGAMLAEHGWALVQVPPQTTVYAVSADGRRIAIADRSRDRVSIQDVSTHESVREIGLDGRSVRSLALSERGERVAVATDDWAVGVYETSTGAEVGLRAGHASQVLSVAWRPDGRRIASVDRSGTVILWDGATFAEIRRLRPMPTALPTSAKHFVSWSGDGSLLAVASESTQRSAAYVYDGDGETELAALPGIHRWGSSSVTITRDGTTLVYRRYTGWETRARPALDPEAEPREHPPYYASADVVWEKDARLLRHYESGEEIRRLLGHWRVDAVSPDGRMIASGTGDRVHVYDGETEQPVLSILFPPGVAPWRDEVEAMAFAADSRRIAAAFESGALRIYSTPVGAAEPWSGVELQRFGMTGPGLGFPVRMAPLAFSPDGTRLVTGGSSGALVVWDVGAR